MSMSWTARSGEGLGWAMGMGDAATAPGAMWSSVYVKPLATAPGAMWSSVYVKPLATAPGAMWSSVYVKPCREEDGTSLSTGR